MIENNDSSIFQQKITPGLGFIIGLLFLALLALAERVLYDLSRTFAAGNLDYFLNLNVIVVHSLFIIPFLILSILVNVAVGERKQKYAVVLIPYFVLSIVLALQLIFQASIYFYFHHNNFQLYLVLLVLDVVCTYAIYEIQRRFQPKGP
ncbi:MAG: hypothetical protein KW802_00040 [Candidatus Doudnabacteria bacterium]|nr:hypothetical protein [Candidatus Doudnabacteria bacterium]